MVEGELTIVGASMLAARGELDIIKIMYLTFLGTLFADQLLFFLGRRWGPKFFYKFPKITKKSIRILDFLRKYNITFILVFRFIYGIRTLSPIVIGFAGVPVKRFMVLNFISALIWTLVSCSAGYFIGDTITAALGKSNIVLEIILLVVIAFIIVWFIGRLMQSWIRKSNS